MLAVTLTVNVAVAVALRLSVTVKVKVALVAVHDAATLAVTLPAPSILRPETVTPAPLNGVAVTFKVLAAWSTSATVAMAETMAALPCCRVSGAAAVIAGEVLTCKAKVALVVAPQLSVAVTVTV